MICLSPLDALDAAIVRALAYTSPNQPGTVITRLPADVRRALDGLTSDLARNVRISTDLQNH